MDYQVLARKWRPHSFAEVVGQQHVLQALSNALTHQRLHHAYLLTGTRGVGKTTIARILAKSLNCEQGITATPCGQCDTCVEIDQGRYVDLLEIDAASRTKVEDTRELLDNVQYRPTRGRYKVYLIDEVHMLSRHSFNALLKTLEEPPEHVKFLLATTDPEKLPVTVLSRCLQFHLRALTREEITQQLGRILQAESLSYDEEALTLLARAAKGSMRDALSLTDQAIAQGNQSVQLESVRNMLGHIEGRRIVELLQCVVAGDAVATLNCLRAMQEKVPDIATVLPELQNALHQIALLQVSNDFADTDIFKDMDALVALAQQLAPELVQVLYRLVLEGRRELPHALDSYSAVEMTLLRLLAFRPQQMQVDATQSKSVAAQGISEPKSTQAAMNSNVSTPAPSESAPSTPVPSNGGASTSAAKMASTDSTQSVEQASKSQQITASSSAAVTPTGGQAPSSSSAQQPSNGEAINQAQVSSADQKPQSVASSSTGVRNTAQSEPQAVPPSPDEYDDYDQDDDFISPAEQAALAQEQTSIMYQAEQQQGGAQQNNANSAQAQPAQAASAQQVEQAQHHQPTADPGQGTPRAQSVTSDDTSLPQADGTDSNLERLMATRELLLAKKKGPLTPETRTAAEIDAWSASLDSLQATGRIRQVLLNSNFKQQGSGYLLTVDEQQRILCTPQVLQELEGLIRQLVGDVALDLEYANPEMTPFMIQQAIDAYRTDNAAEQIQADPLVQRLIQRFDASIDQSSIKAL